MSNPTIRISTRSSLWKTLREGLAKFGLELHLDKMRRIEFGRFAEQNQRHMR